VISSDLLTAADIARLAGVTRATVSNWRRRHADFPAPAGGTGASPAYARLQVEEWLAARGTMAELSLEERVWRAVGAATAGGLTIEDAVSRVAGVLSELEHRGPAEPAGLVRDLAELVREYGWQETLDALIGRYAQAVSRTSALPAPVAELMASLAAPDGAVVFDPAMGSGGLLVAAADHGAARLVGQDVDRMMVRLAALRLGAGEVALAYGDPLREDGFPGLRADVVLCHPPFGVQDWGYDELAGDPRWEYGTPPRPESELAWVQHALARLRPGGRAVLLLPPAVASRPSGRRVRAELVRRGAVRAVIALPAGAVHPRHVPAHVWVLERPGDREPADPAVLFVETAALSGDWERLAGTTIAAWESFRREGTAGAGEPGTWRAVAAIDLLGEIVDLVPARHAGQERSTLSAAGTADRIRAQCSLLLEELAALSAEIPGRGWPSPGRRPRWRMVTLADLGRWGYVVFHRASNAAPGDNDLVQDPQSEQACAVLTASDVLSGRRPSSLVIKKAIKPEWVTIRAGDVVFPAAMTQSFEATVVAEQDEDAVLGRGLHLVRPDPERADSWFLAGFLSNPAIIQRASYGSTASRIDLRRLEVPALPVDEQRRYGAAFRDLHAFEARVREAADLAGRLTGLVRGSLAAGALLPPREQPEGSDHE
jgi:SAM-dependent methyltransferase